MNVLILTDLEGIAGVEDDDIHDRQSEAYRTVCGYLVHSLNLSIETCFQNGAEKVYYLDGHGGGGNVDPEKVDPRAIQISLPDWTNLLKSGDIDCQIEIGAHARAGTIGGFLDHTIDSKHIFYIKHNGREMNEVALHATLCAKYNVPIIYVSGDETVCKQTEEYIPEIYTAAVKRSKGRNEATTFENADEILTSVMAKALHHWKEVPIYSFTEPVVVEQAYYRTDFCEKALAKHAGEVERINARTLRKVVPELKEYKDLRV